MRTPRTATDVFARLVRECLAQPGRLALAVVSLVVLSGAQLYLTWLVKRWADGPLAGDAAAAGPLLAAGVATTAIMVLAVFVSRYVLNDVNQRLVGSLRDQALASLLALRVPAVHAQRSGELVSRLMNDAGLLAGFVRDVLKRLVGEGLVIVGALAMAFYLEWRLALLVALVVPLAAAVFGPLGGAIRRRGARAQADVGDLSATLHEQLRGLTTIKGFGGEAAEHARFAAHNRRYRRAMLRGEWWASLLVTVVWIITGVALWGVLWIGTRSVLAGELTAGGLLAFSLYMLQTLEPLRRLSDVHGLLQRALAAATRVYEIIDADGVEPRGGVALPAPRGRVELAEVCFAYRPNEPVLRDVSLVLRPGEPTALVAASGGGKSTLARLLPRFLEPDAGAVRLDGLDLRTVALADLRRAVCVVEQEPFLFSGPLRDTLRYGCRDAPPARLAEALAMADLEALVGELPAGLGTDMAEAGRTLSVGQQQRIALARAIVRDPAVLVLDEATSALDSDTEGRIFARLDAWLRRRTTLVIAHRLSTISRFERVVVLDAGRVVADGPLAAILAADPACRRLFAEQIGLGDPASGMGF
jgi:subfamily B ATP-binding cassette protein MsbA